MGFQISNGTKSQIKFKLFIWRKYLDCLYEVFGLLMGGLFVYHLIKLLMILYQYFLLEIFISIEELLGNTYI